LLFGVIFGVLPSGNGTSRQLVLGQHFRRFDRPRMLSPYGRLRSSGACLAWCNWCLPRRHTLGGPQSAARRPLAGIFSRASFASLGIFPAALTAAVPPAITDTTSISTSPKIFTSGPAAKPTCARPSSLEIGKQPKEQPPPKVEQGMLSD
jgi:hypothetical protein